MPRASSRTTARVMSVEGEWKESSMSDTLIVLHTAIAILAIVLLIVVAKVDPVPSLVIGTLYLGVAAGLGFADTIGSLIRGFGDIMA